MKERSSLFSALFLALLLLSIGSLIGEVIYGALSGEISRIYATACFLSLIASLVFSLFTIHFFSEKNRLKTREKISLRYFSTGDVVFGETLFTDLVEKRIPKRTKTAYVALFSMKDFKDDITLYYGVDLSTKILSSIADILKSHYFNRKDAYYGYDYIDSFMVYVEADSNVKFRYEFSNLITECETKIKEIGVSFLTDFLIGVVPVPKGQNIVEEHLSVAELLRRAHIACKFHSDIRDKNDVIFFDKTMINAATEELDLSSEIDKALANNDFDICYQPKFDLALKRFNGAEALIRWNHPTRGLISPGAFIPLAEKSGKIAEIDKYVFKRVCDDIISWKNNGTRLMTISINASRRTIHSPDYLEYIRKTIEETKVNPLLLEIELTESIASQDMLFVLQVIKKIKDMKIKVSMDDCGTGYSSLSILKKIPFDTIKMDKSFFDDIEIDKKARDVAQTMVELGHSLEMRVLAEGIQTAKQVAIVKKMNIDSIQGFYYSRALTKFAYENFLVKNQFEEGEQQL